jgi:transcriptional regulator CBF1
MGGTNQSGNQNNPPSSQQNKRKRLNDGSLQQDARQSQQQLQPQQPQQQYSSQQPQQQSPLFQSDPSLQSRYAGLAGTGYRATPGVSSSLQPTLGDAIPQPVNQHPQSSPSSNIGNGSNELDTPNRPPVGSEEWHRLRRDNHKEVERRRRETINDGISELAKIVPGCEKNKGSILARAVQYIQQLKENESHNIEKWTLEKLLTDQAMAELQQTNEKLKLELERAWREAEAWKKTASREDSKRG